MLKTLIPGPYSEFLCTEPKVPSAGRVNAAGLYHVLMLWLERCQLVPLGFGYGPPLPLEYVFWFEITVNGFPVERTTVPDNSHPPTSAFSARPWFRNIFPLPNGSSYTMKPLNALRTSKFDAP